jgi:hypothetical protein
MSPLVNFSVLNSASKIFFREYSVTNTIFLEKKFANVEEIVCGGGDFTTVGWFFYNMRAFVGQLSTNVSPINTMSLLFCLAWP